MGRGTRMIVAIAALAMLGGWTELRAQETGFTASAVTLSAGEATLELELADGSTHAVSLQDGDVLIDGDARGEYVPGGELERSWRALLRSPNLLDADHVESAIAAWRPEAGNDRDVAAAALLERTFGEYGQLGARRAAAAAAAAGLPVTARVVGPNGRQVTIAPGSISLDELTRSVDHLRRSLRHLGPQAEGVDESIALVVHDDYEIPSDRVVPGDLALLDGTLTLSGTIDGDVLVLDGTLILAPSARIAGDVLQVGGDVVTEGGRVDGELVSLVGGDLGDLIEAEIKAELADVVEAPVNVVARSSGPGFFGRVGRNIGRAVGGIVAVFAWFLALGTLGMIVVYFFRQRLEVISDTVRASLARSFGVGLAGELLFFPLLLVLVVGIVTWLAIPFYVIAVALAVPLGYLASAHAAGETMSLQRYSWIERLRFRRNNSYYYVLSGLVFLLAPFAIGSALYLLGGLLGFVRGLAFFAAGVLTWAAVTTGFGAVILTRGGSRTEFANPVEVEDLFGTGDAYSEKGSAGA